MGKSRHASTVSSSRTAPPHGPQFHLGGGSSNGRRERKGRSFEPGSIQRRGVSIESTPQCIGLGPIAAFIVSDHASTAHCGCSKVLTRRLKRSNNQKIKLQKRGENWVDTTCTGLQYIPSLICCHMYKQNNQTLVLLLCLPWLVCK